MEQQENHFFDSGDDHHLPVRAAALVTRPGGEKDGAQPVADGDFDLSRFALVGGDVELDVVDARLFADA
jgi:hypothetical protein